MPDRRASPPTKGAGPKLPWPHAKAVYRNIVTARFPMEQATSPPPRGEGASRSQPPRTPPMAMAWRGRRPPLAADILTVKGKLFVCMRTSIRKNYTKLSVYGSELLLNVLFTANGAPPESCGTSRATRTNGSDDTTDTTNTTYRDHGMITYIIITSITLSWAGMKWTQVNAARANGKRRARAGSPSRC